MLMFYTLNTGAGILGMMVGITTIFGKQELATVITPFGFSFMMTLPFSIVALTFFVLQGMTQLCHPGACHHDHPGGPHEAGRFPG